MPAKRNSKSHRSKKYHTKSCRCCTCCRKHRSRKSHRGGIIGQAAAPGLLWAAQYNYNKKKGGSQYPSPSPSSYDSGASFVRASVGNGNEQYDNVFLSNKNMNPSNTIVGLQGQNMTQKAGRKRGGNTKSKKGGYWGQVINQAVVPFSLWGMHHNYKKK